MKKIYLVPVVFMAAIIATSAAYLIVPDKDISEEENRTLASFPSFSLKSLADGSFTAGLNDYMSDQFPFRSSFMKLGNGINELLSLKGGEIEMVMSTGSVDMGEGEMLAEIPEEQKKKKPEAAKIDVAEEADYNSRGIIISGDRAMEIFGYEYNMLKNYATIVNGFKNTVPNVNVYSLVIPTAVEFYSPVKYHEGRHSQKAAISEIQSMLAETVVPIDAYTYLAAEADRYLYFRTDHHWTARGAYQGYYGFCEAAGFEPVPEEDFAVTTVEGGFLGTLYRYTRKQVLADNPDTVEVLTPPEVESCIAYTSADMSYSYDTDVIVDPGKSTNKYLAFLGGDNPLLHIVTNNKNGRRVLILKDSFGNAFVPYLINHYEEIYAIDPRSAACSISQFCADHAIDDLIVENYALALGNSEILKGLKSMLY